MKRPQEGFTLLEVIVVIAILGILGAVAVSKFVDLTTDAGNSAAAGVASALISGSSMNYSLSLAKGAGNPAVVRINGVTTCSNLATSLLTGFDPSGFSITGSSTAACATAGATFACSVTSTKPGATQVVASMLCTG